MPAPRGKKSILVSPPALPRTALVSFQTRGSPVFSFQEVMSICPTCVNVVVTCSAGDQGLAMACSHNCDPRGLWCSSPRLEVFQCSNMVYLDLLVRTAEFARLSQEPFFQL
jgi:hypothetical protein